MPGLLEQLKSLNPGSRLNLLPPYPPVALQLDPQGVALVRLKRKGKGNPVLEVHAHSPVEESEIPASIFETAAVTGGEELRTRLRGLFESTETRPGRVSLVIPDNLAKITLLPLPERPASRKHLDQLVRAQMRRAVPFRLEDASLSYQVLPGEGRGVVLLVAIVRRSLVEQYENALASFGARVGLVDLCTPNLINLCRAAINKAGRDGGDSAVLNCTRNYFSLAIMRDERLIFFRCKSYAIGPGTGNGPNGVLTREIDNSLSYYKEKLDGEGIGRVFVRSVDATEEEIGRRLGGKGLGEVRLIDPCAWLSMENGSRLDPEMGQRLSPAIAAAVGRG